MLVEDMSGNKCFTFYMDLWPSHWLRLVNKYLLRMRGTFHDAVEQLDYIASYGNMTHQYWIGKDLEGRGSDHTELLCRRSLKVLRKSMRKLGQDSHCPSRDSNWQLPEHVQSISARIYPLKVAGFPKIHSHTTEMGCRSHSGRTDDVTKLNQQMRWPQKA
jgi:hypothetical protein